MTALAFAAAKLKVADSASLTAFYTKAFGFAVTATIEEGEGPNQIREVFLALPGGPALLALLEYVNQPAPAPGEVIIALAVADLEASIASVVAHGGSDVTGIIPVPQHNLRLAFVADPEGHQIELLQYLQN